MLRLAAVDAAAAVVFGVVYAAAGHRILGQAAFVAAVGVVFVTATALWVHVEDAHSGTALRRLGRILGAFVLTAVAIPVLVLTPMFGLRQGLPPDAPIDDVIRPALVLLLVSVVLVAIMNAAGACVLAAATVARALKGDRMRRR